MISDELLELVHAAKSLLQEESLRRSSLFTHLSFQLPSSKSGQIPIKTTPPYPLYPKKKNEPFSSPDPGKVGDAETPLAPQPRETPSPLLPEKVMTSSDALRTLIQKSCPHLSLKEEIPNDQEAIQRKNAWRQREYQAEILILSFTTNPTEKKFLENVAKAISSFRSAQVIDALQIEDARGWKAILDLPQLSKVLAPPLETWRTPLLKSLVVEQPHAKQTYLGKARLHFLLPLENYLSNPSNKQKLWHSLNA